MTSDSMQDQEGGTAMVRFVLGGDLPHLANPPFRSAPANGIVEYPLKRRTSLKDALEAIGPPHTEVGALRVEGREVGFGHLLQAGQTIEVIPPEPPVDFTRPTRLKPWAPARPAFLADVNVGGLATQLRVLGFDTFYDNTLTDAEAAQMAEEERRIVLTRDRALLKRSKVVWGRLLRSGETEEQLLETLRFFGLAPPYASFTRCARCNEPLVPVDKKDVLHRLEPKTRKYYEKFTMCPSCGRIYWAGSHYERLGERLRNIAEAFYQS
ncbi:Mut7-C ubiquitin/RNAse domain-containing protein [Oceanidesulfovibrio indonesiensis]|nr:Mut7-C ubiquitin/RNAse domain-containing protein [Oceanidesulfovibrio indonesiensis]